MRWDVSLARIGAIAVIPAKIRESKLKASHLGCAGRSLVVLVVVDVEDA